MVFLIRLEMWGRWVSIVEIMADAIPTVLTITSTRRGFKVVVDLQKLEENKVAKKAIKGLIEDRYDIIIYAFFRSSTTKNFKIQHC